MQWSLVYKAPSGPSPYAALGTALQRGSDLLPSACPLRARNPSRGPPLRRSPLGSVITCLQCVTVDITRGLEPHRPGCESWLCFLSKGRARKLTTWPAHGEDSMTECPRKHQPGAWSALSSGKALDPLLPKENSSDLNAVLTLHLYIPRA